MLSYFIFLFFFFFNDTATTEIYTLSLHDALPICRAGRRAPAREPRCPAGGGRRRRVPRGARSGAGLPERGAGPGATLRGARGRLPAARDGRHAIRDGNGGVPRRRAGRTPEGLRVRRAPGEAPRPAAGQRAGGSGGRRSLARLRRRAEPRLRAERRDRRGRDEGSIRARI